MATNGFSLPTDAHIFVNEVRERCEGLIETGIWEGLSKTRLHAWLKNFKTEEERYFSACVLDSLIFRSEKQTIALIKQGMQRTLPDFSREAGFPTHMLYDWIELLKGEKDPQIRVVTVVEQVDPPTKSAHHIVRLMKRNFHTNEQWILSAWNLLQAPPPKGTIILFVDDFLGTGTQFTDFFLHENLKSVENDFRFIYMPLAGFSQGILKIEGALSAVKVRAVETLTNANRLFHDESECFLDDLNCPKAAEDFCYELMLKRDIQIEGNNRRGYGGLELAYSFSHAVPDNCLPILWWKRTPGFAPLLDR